MPVSHSFRDRIVVMRMEGNYTTADLRQEIEGALDDPERPRLIGMLFDVSRSTALADRTAAEVNAMGHFLAERSAAFGRRLALVASSDVAYGLMRMGAVATESDGVETRVFRDSESAEQWLTRHAPAVGGEPA